MLEPLDRANLMDALKKIPSLLEDLDVTLTRSDATGDIKVGGPIPPGMRLRPLPYRVNASDARAALVDSLRTYALRVGHYVNVAPPHLPYRRAEFLIRHLPGVPDDVANVDGITVITALVADGETVVDRPEERFCIGSCAACDAYLYGGPEQTHVECEHCGTVYPAGEMREALLEQASDCVGTAAELARILPWFLGKPFTTDRIRKWGARGKIKGVTTVGGRKVYRVGDVLDVIRRGDL